jgi:hypothetical protein
MDNQEHDNQESGEQEKQSSWDDLARNLGANASSEPILPKAKYVKTTQPDEPRRVEEPAPRPKPSPKSWDNLAADFGLEVPPPPPKPVPPKPTPVERAKVERPPSRAAAEPETAPAEDTGRPAARRGGDRPPRRERERERPARREESSETDDRPPRRSRGGRSRGGGRRDERPSEDRPREERPRPERQQQRPREEAHTEDRAEARDEPRESAPSPPTEQPTPPAAAPGRGVSLWHKIFGTPDQQAERITESVKSAEIDDDSENNADRGRRRRGRDEESFAGETSEGGVSESLEIRESWQTESVEFKIDDGGDAENRADRDTADEGEGRPRRRRRGRGRGGRGRRSEGERSGEADSPESTSDRTESSRESRDAGTEREPRGRGRGSRSGRPRRDNARRREEPRENLDDDGLEEIILDDDQDDFDENDMDGVDGEETTAAGNRVREAPLGHKSIPSWDEAIGMIVETNLSTRTDRRRSGPAPSRGSGSSRGRARGGRRRKKPS